MKQRIINLSNCEKIVVNTDGKGNGDILTEGLRDTSPGSNLYNAAIDGMESLILSLVCSGYNINRKAFKISIRSALDAIVNNI